jgi:hypothetical protein
MVATGGRTTPGRSARRDKGEADRAALGFGEQIPGYEGSEQYQCGAKQRLLVCGDGKRHAENQGAKRGQDHRGIGADGNVDIAGEPLALAMEHRGHRTDGDTNGERQNA